MIFLAGLPRSGSTVLASLLSQRTDTYVSGTSGLGKMLGTAIETWGKDQQIQVGLANGDGDIIRVLQAIIKAHYENRSEPVIIDKSRGWASPAAIERMLEIQNEVKIIATVRPMAECVSSFVKLVKPSDVRAYCNSAPELKLLFKSYDVLRRGYEAHPECFLLVEYDALVSNPQKEADRIADFLELPSFQHDLNNLPPVSEDDEIWGIPDLHKVRPKLEKKEFPRKDILGPELWEYYQGGEFWNDKPEPVKKEDFIDLQLEAGLRGDFKKGWELAQKLEKKTPDCSRAAFNRGWYLLRQGKLLEGHKLLDKGRSLDVFGNRHIGTTKPVWNGEEGTVLLNMEGGLGDQIKSYRFAFDLQERGNRVIVCCSPELAPMFAEKFPVVEHDAACGAYHDYWLPSMSAVVPFGYEYKDLKGEPYIERTADPIPGRIGVRWSGNPEFEHEQYRFFPADLMFDAVKGYNCVSLQRDKDAELRPGWMKQAPLEDWQATRKSISQCELVISSCTSVAHLAAAMGVKTWIVVPILSYFLWALPGDMTPYYDSVTLFRQQKYGSWEDPFMKIKEQLQCMHTLKKMAA